MQPFCPEQFRQLFPLLNQPINGKPFLYFDNAATTQKITACINTTSEYYQYDNANVHRGAYSLSANTTKKFEQAREYLAKYINAKSSNEIIWTKGTTEAINLIAQCLTQSELKPGDEIVLSESEHHANIVPWQAVAERLELTIKVLPLDAQGRIDVGQLESVFSDKTKLVSVAHVSNVIGKKNDIDLIIKHAKAHGAYTFIDGAQAIAHMDIDVQVLDCDFYAFSAHKCYGPTGLGVLYGKQAILNALPPYQFGGEMVKTVSFTKTTYNTLPYKFEAGTPNISAAIAFASTLKQLASIDKNARYQYENKLTEYAFNALKAIDGIEFITQQQPDLGIISFNLSGIHHQDLASFLDAHGIAVRAGSHCAMPLMAYLSLVGCVRVSLSPYNTFEEVDKLCQVIKNFIELNGQIPLEISDAITTKPHASRSKEQSENLEDIINSADNNTLPSRLYQKQIADIIDNFVGAKSWDAKHRHIMLYGKKLSRMAAIHRTSDTLINGCESQAWLNYEINADNQLQFESDSDAKVIRGLLYVTTLPYQYRTPEEIISFDIKKYFATLGLLQHLSPSRGNGLLAIVKKIESIANKHL